MLVVTYMKLTMILSDDRSTNKCVCAFLLIVNEQRINSSSASLYSVCPP